MRTKKRKTTAWSVAAVLFCLVLVTAHFTSGMYARFVTKAENKDRGNAAEFDVQASPTKATVIAGEEGYQIELKNYSDVRVSYEAVIQFDDSADTARFEPLPTFTGTLEPGTEKTTDSFVFQLIGTDGTGSAPFTVTVTFTQID